MEGRTGAWPSVYVGSPLPTSPRPRPHSCPWAALYSSVHSAGIPRIDVVLGWFSWSHWRLGGGCSGTEACFFGSGKALAEVDRNSKENGGETKATFQNPQLWPVELQFEVPEGSFWVLGCD